LANEGAKKTDAKASSRRHIYERNHPRDVKAIFVRKPGHFSSDKEACAVIRIISRTPLLHLNRKVFHPKKSTVFIGTSSFNFYLITVLWVFAFHGLFSYNCRFILIQLG